MKWYSISSDIEPSSQLAEIDTLQISCQLHEELLKAQNKQQLYQKVQILVMQFAAGLGIPKESFQVFPGQSFVLALLEQQPSLPFLQQFAWMVLALLM
jgi:hypothetical protein